MAGRDSRNTLGDYFTLQRGTTYKSQLLGQPGPVLLGLATIQRNGGFRTDSLQTYGGDSPDKLLVQPGELYLSLKDVTQSADLLGAVARLPRDHPPGRLTQDTVRLEPKDANVPLEYLYWLLRTPQYRSYCRSRATGTTNLGLAREDFLAFPAPKPTPTQLRIVETLGSLDDKIELNRRMNSTLETMARAVFKSWFVDFDPVRAKAEGRDPGLPKPLADLFPDSFKDSELGEIPKGWEVLGLGQCLALLKDGSHNPPGRVQEGIRFIAGATDVKHFSVDFTKCTYISEDDYSVIHRRWSVYAGDVLLTIVGTVGNVALVAQYDLPFSFQRSIAVLRPGPMLPSSFLFCLVDSPGFQADMESRLNPTAQPGIYLGTLAAIPICLPTRDVVMAFDTVASAVFTRMQNTVQASRTLAALRDTLLPKLISGELRVNDVDAVTEPQS